MSETAKKKSTAKVATKKAATEKSGNVPYITEVQVNYGITLNLGDYESFRADARVTVHLDGKVPRNAAEAELVREAMFKSAWKTVQEELADQVRKVKEKRSQNSGK